MPMGSLRFERPKGGDDESSPNLYVANCGPAVGLSFDTIESAFSAFGQIKGVYAADETGTRVIVSYFEVDSAREAKQALDGRPCHHLGGRVLRIRPSVLHTSCKVIDSVPVSLTASELNIQGLYLVPDFITLKEEEELLAAVDRRPWKNLSKRRVQHYGYDFCYETRNVNTKECLGDLPSFVSPTLERILSFPELANAANVILDQLTVNEYPPGVGLSPHIDTHSAFEGLIFSLSLAGPCVMEFRRYSSGVSPSKSNVLRRAIYLPPRSILLLSEEARYAWHHYIPHHKVDLVKGTTVRRGSRRVSFTFRKVRTGPCRCAFPQYCDSQR